MQKVFVFLYVLLLFTNSKLSFSAELAIAEQSHFSLQPYVSWYFDPTGKTDIYNIINHKKNFIPSPNKIHFNSTNGAHWLYFTIYLPKNSVQKNWLLKLSYTQLDHLDLYTKINDSPLQHQKLGDAVPKSEQNNFYPYPVFPITLAPENITHVYLRIQGNTSINAPLTLWQHNSFDQHEQQNLLMSGIVYGIFIGLLFYNLFLYTTVKNPAYLWFVLYLFSFSLFQFSMEGYSKLYFWPEWPALADRSVSFALWLSMASGLRFTQHISLSHKYAPQLDRLLSSLVIFAFCIAVITLITGPTITFPLLVPFGLMVTLLIPVPLFLATNASYKPARFALLAFLPILPGALLIAARSLAVIEPTFWTEHLFSIGAAISAIILSLALADRINFLREEKSTIQSQLLKTERDAHEAKKTFSNKLIQTQDDERKRLANELHDSVGQNLSFLANALNQLKKKTNEKIIQNASQMTRDAVNEIRVISHQLHPHILDQLGLIAAIESITERIEEQTHIRCNANAAFEPNNLNSSTQLHIYRIIQESLNNAIKHSQASQIDVDLKQKGQCIILSIADNGIGLSKTSPNISPNNSPNTGLGLESIKHRITLLKGSLELKANTPHGLIVYITLPIQESI